MARFGVYDPENPEPIDPPEERGPVGIYPAGETVAETVEPEPEEAASE